MEQEVQKTAEVTSEKPMETVGASQGALLAKIKNMRLSRQNKKLLIFWLIVAVIFGALYAFKGVFIAATVNGSPVSRLSVISELEKKAGKNALDTLITKKLIANEMKKLGVTVNKEDVDTEMNTIETQLTAQGLALDQALAEQGMTTDELREQITINKGLEHILADKLVVSDDEINQYLSENSAFLGGQGASSEDQRKQAIEQLKGQKFNMEAAKWVSDLRTKADIRYYTQY